MVNANKDRMEINRRNFSMYVKEWEELSNEKKSLYEVAAAVINAINKFEDKESSFTGFNIWIARCENKKKILDELLGV
jgi:hypothetical protein